MATQPRTAVTPGDRFYEDDEPSSEWIRGETSNTLILRLPGYKREHLKLQIDSRRQLKASGERPVGGDRWSRFSREFKLPQPCAISDIRAEFKNEILHVILPKRITRAGAHGRTPANETEPAHGTHANTRVYSDPDAAAGAREDAKKGVEKVEEQRVSNRIRRTREGKGRNEMVKQATSGGHGEGRSRVYRASARRDMSSILMELGKYKSLLIDAALLLMMLLGLGVYMKMKNMTEPEAVKGS